MDKAPATLPVTVTVPLTDASAFGAVMPLAAAAQVQPERQREQPSRLSLGSSHHSGGGRLLSRRSGSIGDGHLGGVFVIIAIGAHYT